MAGNRAIKTVLALSVCAVFAFFPGCSSNPTLAGGVETTNGLTVVASGLTVRGSAPAGSTVSLFADSYNPLQTYRKAFSDSAAVDSGKTFSFKQIADSGMYNVIAINSLTRRGATISSLFIRPGGRDSIFIPFDTLGKISGSVTYVKNADTVAVGLLNVYCKGSNFFTHSDSAGHYALSDIPLGTYRVALVLGISAAVGESEFEMEQPAVLNGNNVAVINNFAIAYH